MNSTLILIKIIKHYEFILNYRFLLRLVVTFQFGWERLTFYSLPFLNIYIIVMNQYFLLINKQTNTENKVNKLNLIKHLNCFKSNSFKFYYGL